jgi:hypothetical protein
MNLLVWRKSNLCPQQFNILKCRNNQILYFFSAYIAALLFYPVLAYDKNKYEGFGQINNSSGS